MPRYDRTGPMGAGPGTGRGLGYCVQSPVTGRFGGFGMFRENRPGRGLGNRCFGPRGWWQRFWQPTVGPTDEAASIKAALAAAKEEIAAMEAILF
jgi:hypothetical protein